jgi:hypothetical protein
MPRLFVSILLVLVVGAVLSPMEVGWAAFQGRNGKMAFVCQPNPPSPEEICVINPDGTDQTQLTHNSYIDRDPAWSADGYRITFVRYFDSFWSEIYIMNADGSGETRLTFTSDFNIHPVWSPDGWRIAFSSNRGGVYGVYVINADGSGLTRLSSGNAGPAWSPDGSKIAFPNWDGINTINSDGSGQTRITTKYDDHSPDWSPDGSKIAFVGQAGRAGHPQIYVMDARGENYGVTCLSNNPWIDEEPAWSPDSSKITFWSGRAGYTQVYVMNADGSDQTYLVNGYSPDWQPTVVPNQPPQPPAFLFQYKPDGTEIPVGGSIREDTVTLLGVVSDPDHDRVKLQIELRRLDEYAGSFIGIPTHESEFVDSDFGVTISIQGLIHGSYHWQARTVDKAGATSDWLSFGNNLVSESDFTVVVPERVFRPPYRVFSRGGWSESHLGGDAFYYSAVDPAAGEGNVRVGAKASFGGDGKATASFTLEDHWKNEWSGTSSMLATFSISGFISWVSVSLPPPLPPGEVYLGITLLASLRVYEWPGPKEIWHKDLFIYDHEPEWKLISIPEADSLFYRDSQYAIQGLVDLEEDRSYSWRFEVRISTWLITAGVATAFAGGNITAELVDVRVGPPVLRPEPEPIVGVEDVMYVAVGSPVDMLVADPEGRRVGFDFASMQEVNEIPEAWYSGRETDPQFIRIPRPAAGHYDVLLSGTGTDTYTIITFMRFTTPETVSFVATNIPTSANAIHQYTLDWDALSIGEEGVVVQIDSEGDGIFEQIVTADNELTHDEFMLQTATTVAFDPETVNLKSKGKWVTVYIELPLGYDVGQVDLSSILLNRTVPILAKPTAIGDYDKDGIPDLMVKFDRAAVIALFKGKTIPGTYVIEVTGTVMGICFKGTDTTRVMS